MPCVQVRPSDVLYSQDSIRNRFKNGVLIGEVLDDIISGKLSVTSLPKIEVSVEDGKYVSADNRRLWIFKELEQLGHLKQIQAKKKNKIGYKGKCARTKDVKIRGDGPGGDVEGRMCKLLIKVIREHFKDNC